MNAHSTTYLPKLPGFARRGAPIRHPPLMMAGQRNFIFRDTTKIFMIIATILFCEFCVIKGLEFEAPNDACVAVTEASHVAELPRGEICVCQ